MLDYRKKTLFATLLFSLPFHSNAFEQLAYVDHNQITQPYTYDLPQLEITPERPFNQIMVGRLHEALMDLEQMHFDLDWPNLSNGPLLRLGDSHEQIPILREILSHLGDLQQPAGDDQSPLFDNKLHNALVAFQKRHGAKADGILGPSTRKSLSISPQERADQILLNIYRIQQFKPLTHSYIRVNIPDYRLHLIEDGNEALSMKTIVGKKKRKTPVFNTEINRVVVNPSWHVPKSIAYKDILPELDNDPDYLQKKNLKVVTGWGAQQKVLDQDEIDLEKMYRGNNYQRLWEPPSERNTLGKVKFLTNGPHSIYLHDTSARRLFEKEKRAFSSGCIRVEQPQLLANALMNVSNQKLSTADIEKYFDDSKTVQINLRSPIPLYVTYWTSWVDGDGTLHFRDDLYKHDDYELSQLKKGLSQEFFTSTH